MSQPIKPSIAIVGCGKVGSNLGWFLAKRSYPLAVACRRLESARTAALRVKTDAFSDRAADITRDADIVFITTPDGSIAATCRDIAAQKGFKKNAVVLHCSGSLPSTILEAPGREDLHFGSLHPLQSFASLKTDTNPFRDVIAAIEGDDAAVSAARRIAEDLGANPLSIKTEAKAMYHAAAVAASNYLVSLLDLSFRCMAEAGIEGDNAVRALYPLIQGTLANIERVGIPAALTGPISRGDAATCADHLNHMETLTPDLVSLYKALGRHTLTLATRKGNLPEEKIAALEAVLKEAGPLP